MTYVCENCLHEDDDCWYLPFSRGMEVSYTRLAELQLKRPDLYQALMNAPLNQKNPIREVVVGPYAYGLWKRKGYAQASWYVRRRRVTIWKYHGWKPIPMEKANHKGIENKR